MKITTEDYNLPFNTHNLYGVFVDEEEEIETLVTHDASIVASWIANIELVYSSQLDSLIVGLDVECKPVFTKGCHPPAAVLQLCVGKHCLVFQIRQSRRIPRRLRKFLENTNYTFVGVGVGNDAKMLWDDFRLKVGKTRELGPWAAATLGRYELSRAGLKTLVREVVGLEMEKPKTITMSGWHKPVLSLPQIAYACLDAYFSFEIARRLTLCGSKTNSTSFSQHVHIFP